MNSSILKLALLSSAMMIAPSVAFAQEASAEDEGGIADIVVTARKTNENLQTTPVAVTAITTEALETQQILQTSDLQRIAPGLSFAGAGTGPSSILTFAIRGNAQNSPNSASDAAVGIYVDGVYQGRPIGSNLGILDLANVEVLRGTQGTLFGRNTTGGAVQFTTVQPGGEFKGYVKAGIGNYKDRLVEGAVTVPLQGEQLGIRLAARYTEHDGYARNVPRNLPLFDLKSDVSARATIRWAPESMPVKLTVSGEYIKSRDSGTHSILAGVNPTGPLGTLFPGQFSPSQIANESNFYQNFGDPKTLISAINTPNNRTKAKGVYGTLDVDLGDIELKSTTAYRETDSSNALDLDSTPAGGIEFASFYTQHQFSEELQLSGKTGGLDWIVGAYYFKEGGTERSDSQPLHDVPAFTFLPAGLRNLAPSARSLADFNANSKAVFAQANYHLTDKLRATAGFRYTWDSRSINRHGVRNITGAPQGFFVPAAGGVVFAQPNTCTVGPTANTVSGTNCNDPKAAKFKYPAWTIGVDYELGDDLFIYAKTGGAALAGGFNTRPTPAGLDSFRPEKVKDAELGFKGEFFDRHLRTNIALFHNWRNGVQNIVNVFANGTLTQFVQNSGNVRSYGGEIEATLVPWKGMEITSAFSRLHSKYVAGSFVGIGAGRVGQLPSGSGVLGANLIVDRSGETVNQAPKSTFNIGATQKVDAPWGSASLHMDYAYISKRAFSQDTPDLTGILVAGVPRDLTPAQRTKLINDYATANQLATLKGYGLFNMRVTFEFENPGLELALWGRNLGKTQYAQNQFASYNALGFVAYYPGAPKTYGATVSLKW
jgi:iron complex outermembrane recepter protein